MNRSTIGRVGVGQKRCVGDDRQRTPPRNIRPIFTNTSIHRLADVCALFSIRSIVYL
jgi:hypothetical protein